MANRYVTIKDIARTLNISVATVSRALRDTYDVSDNTRKLVLAAAEKMNYRPNFNATGLVKRTTHKIAVIIPSITNYYFSTVITGIQSFAASNGYQVILYLTNDSPEWEARTVKELSLSSIDGVLACVTSNTNNFEHFQELIDAGLPVILFDRLVQSLKTSTVMQDDYNGACIATEHLIANGYHRIAHITGPAKLSLTEIRLKGFLDTLKRFNLNSHGVQHSGFSKEDGENDLNAIWCDTNPPDAIFAVNDRKAVGAIIGLQKKGIEIGRQVGVVGFTNDPISEIIKPALTTVAEPAFEIGKTACQLLIKHIEKPSTANQQIVLPSELIVRKSTTRNL
ncbi:LacI family DNA-binding transcriptional regulator [Dyadobacter sp. CY323]|uniref:LacI family DNA-binding transcriptional regulator n=1 Tax=Dyadobacter sp. CY323 TaxID=2907302 RepID=UPI001F48AF62|nr:LacI family DNA-binding transcriptional regulator [Dyadobacter sp. CY323]MCE6992329.1 LacI family transcriptional regulator [Dyadobacter sp. CY323]